MSKRDEVIAELDDLVDQTTDLIKAIAGDHQKSYDRFAAPYQIWYTKALSVMNAFATDRLDEFRRYYDADPRRKRMDVETYVVQDFLSGIGLANSQSGNLPFDTLNITRIRVGSQASILAAVRARLPTVLADIEGALAASLEDSTIVAARQLSKVNLRASGALAGVVIEEHLQRVAVAHAIKVTKRAPTIADLNDPLKNGGVYDLAAWRRIQYLADLRNKCVHKKDAEPTALEVADLVNGAEWLVKNIA